jgi:hypothetical protein
VTSCEICGRDASDDELCRYHLEALNNLKTGYDGWKKATGMNWEDYMEKIVHIEETGRWVLDVIERIKQQDDPLEEM